MGLSRFGGCANLCLDGCETTGKEAFYRRSFVANHYGRKFLLKLHCAFPFYNSTVLWMPGVCFSFLSSSVLGFKQIFRTWAP